MELNRSKWLVWLLGVLMVLAPLFRSGKIPSAMLLLELLALVILLVLWWSPGQNRKLGWSQGAALAGLMLLPLIYLIPLPGDWAGSLPGRADYTLAQLLAGGLQATEGSSFSLYSRESFAGWLVLLIPLATFLAARSLNTRQIRSLLTLLFVITAFQAVLGLVQFGTGPGSPAYLGMEKAYGSAVGTYPSRNNYVGLLYMVLMVTLALFMATLGRHRAQVGHQTFRQRLVYLSTMRGHQAFLYGAFSLLILLAIIFSRSRGGIGVTMLGIVLASVLFSNRIGGRNVFGLSGSIIAVVLGLGVSIGLAPVLDRFAAGDAVSNARWTIYDGTLQGISQFFPVGSGPATFRETFHPFQDISQGSYIINNAHNDYLEWTYDGGVLAAGLIIAFLLLYIIRWSGVWKRERWGEFRFIQVGAGLGMLLILLHELLDYNLYVPANMVFFAFMAALFFHEYEEESDPGLVGRRTTKHATPSPSRAPSARVQTVSSPSHDEDDWNPFKS